jgi:hypothetical protein
MSRWYGSLENRLMETSNMPKPEVGMGATECLWSDREPYEVIAVKDDRHITVRRLDYKRVDHNGYGGQQEYEYFSNENNPVCNLFFTKKGVWRERYADRSLGCTRFVIGFAERYYDPSF